MPEGYMDAAAVPVPDGGDDTLRDRLAEAITERLFRGGEYNSITIGRYTSLPLSLADALLPLIRDRIAAAVQAERAEAEAKLKAERATLHCACGGSIDVPSQGEWVKVADNWRFNHRNHGETGATDGTR